MKNTYVKCADWSWEDKLLYIKTCIGDDIPHEKFCVYVGLSKDELLSLYRDAWYIYCCDNGMIVYDGKTNNPFIGSRVEIKLSDLKQEKQKPTKFVKIKESIFDLKEEFEMGELYEKGSGYTKLISESDFAFACRENAVYRKVEIDWIESVTVLTPIGYGVERSPSNKLRIEGSYTKKQALILANAIIESLTDKPE